MSRRSSDVHQDEPDHEAMKARIRDLEEKIAIMNDGTQVSREEYEALQKRLRSEQDDHLQIISAYRDIENRLETSKQKCQKYEEKIKKYKELSSARDKTQQGRDQQILDLKKNKSEMESLNVKHRQDILSYIAENKRLSDANRRFEAHIRDVDIALNQMYERNQELTRAYQESEARNYTLLQELDVEKDNVRKLENNIARLRMEDRMNEYLAQESHLESVKTDYANMEQELYIAKNKIADLQNQNDKLKEEAAKAAKLHSDLIKQKKINENLAKQNEDYQMEIDSIRRSGEECKNQINDYHKKIKDLDENYRIQIDILKEELKHYRNQTKSILDKNTELEDQISQKEKEFEDLKDELAKYLDETYGLPQAINEIRQLRTMVSVRDAQIADMIVENQWTQKVIYALEERLPDNFDTQKFFDELQKREIQFQQRRAERNIYALLKKTLEENKESIVGEIKVVLGTGSKHKKTLTFNNESESGLLKKIASGLRKSRRTSALDSSEANYDTDRTDMETDSMIDSGSENEMIASSAMSIMMKSKQRKDRERKKQEESNLEQALSSIPRVTSSKMITADASCQIYPDELDARYVKKNDTNEEESGNDDKWVRDLKNKLKKVKEEKATLADQVKSARDEFNKKSIECDQKSIEIRTLTARIEDLLVEVDSLKSKLKQGDYTSQGRTKTPKSARRHRSELDVSETETDDGMDTSSDYDSSRRRRRSFKRVNREDDPLRVELKTAKVQVIAPGVNVSISKRPVYFEVRPVKPKLAYEYNDESVFQLPTPEELEIIDARIKVLQSELFEAETKAAESAREVEDLKRKIEQKDEMIDEMRKTNFNLEQRLDEQRINFNEKLTAMNNDAERILEARLKEARDMDAINNNLLGNGQTESNLAEVSMRMEQLNRDKAKLIDELTETKEALKFMQRQNDQLKERLSQLQKDYRELSDKQMESSHRKLADYSSGLKMKFTALQKKYTDLQRNYEDLKKYKEFRNEPLTSTSAARSVADENEGPPSARDSAKLKSAMMKIEQMKTQNEEMQLRLGKAQTTIERLNQLLQRKENQLTKVQEQATQYKHMLAKQQMSKKT